MVLLLWGFSSGRVGVRVRVNFWKDAFLTMHKCKLTARFFTTEDTLHIFNVIILTFNRHF